jgi:hypothetical protein
VKLLKLGRRPEEKWSPRSAPVFWIFNRNISEARAANTQPAVVAYIRPILEAQEPWWDGLTDKNCWENLQRVDPALWGNYFLNGTDAGDNPPDSEKHLPNHVQFLLEKKRQLESFAAAGGKFLDKGAPLRMHTGDIIMCWALPLEDEGYPAFRELFEASLKAGAIHRSDVKIFLFFLDSSSQKTLLQAFPA